MLSDKQVRTLFFKVRSKELKQAFKSGEAPATLVNLMRALYYSNIDLAEIIIDNLSDEEKNKESYYYVYNHFKALNVANNGGVCAFPLSVPFDKWFDGPHVAPLVYEGRTLKKWIACRVSGFYEDDRRLNLDAYFDGKYGTIDKVKLEISDLEKGDFLELAMYGDVDKYIAFKYHDDFNEGWYKKLPDTEMPDYEDPLVLNGVKPKKDGIRLPYQCGVFPNPNLERLQEFFPEMKHI